MILARANCTTWALPDGGWSGPDGHSGWATIGIYRKADKGFGFTVGTTDWAFGLAEDANVARITMNVLEILGDTYQPQKFLLQNPDFESWQGSGQNEMPKGWYREGDGNVIKYSPGYSGTYCLAIEASGNDGLWVSQNYIPCRTNRDYKVSCRAKGGIPSNSAGGDITIRLQTIADQPIGYNNFATAEYTDPNNNWQLIDATGSISNTEDLLVPVRVKIQVASGVTAYFDEVTVEEL